MPRAAISTSGGQFYARAAAPPGGLVKCAMPPQRALVVKLSSLGDVIHQLPALTDLRRHRPDLSVDWLVEEAYAPLAALHPAVREVIPAGLRRLRDHPAAPANWRAAATLISRLRASRFDWVVDSQGLLKSAALACIASGPRFGYDRQSIREPLASAWLDVRLRVSRQLHAVERIRRLFAATFGYRPEGAIDYGLSFTSNRPAWAPGMPYVVGLHATSQAEKCWPEACWQQLAAQLGERGLSIVYPAGTAAERTVAKRLAAANPRATVAPPMTLHEAAALLAHASGVVGVDTGLAHLAVALGTPTVGVYVATDATLTGLVGASAVANLGAPGATPSPQAVFDALAPRLRTPA